MKKILVSIELALLNDVIKIIGGIVTHKYGFCHDEISSVKQNLIERSQLAIQEYHQNKINDDNEKKGND